jgi:hypothetical protein
MNVTIRDCPELEVDQAINSDGLADAASALAGRNPAPDVFVNNCSTTELTVLPSAQIIHAATLVATALKHGRIKINPDGSITLDGASLTEASLPPGAPPMGIVRNYPFRTVKRL